MKRIQSFCVNHDKLKKGIYLSRIDGDAVTYDIRMVIPNGGIYLDCDGMHTIEHLFATFVRNSEYSDNVIYFGPMGCRTGFYFILRDKVSHKQAIKLILEAFQYIKDFEGEIPGSSKIECGNYLEHNLLKAKSYADDICKVIAYWTEDKLIYEI